MMLGRAGIGLSGSTARWVPVLVILALFGVDRFGGAELQALHLSFIGAYLFLVLVAIFLPLVEGRSVNQILDGTALVSVFIGIGLYGFEVPTFDETIPFVLAPTNGQLVCLILLCGSAFYAVVKLLLPLFSDFGFLGRDSIQVAGQRVLPVRSKLFVRLFSALIIIYHLAAAMFGAPEVMKFRPTHVAMVVSLIFLLYAYKRSDQGTSVPWFDWMLAVFAWVPAAYIYLNYFYVVDRYPYVSELTMGAWLAGIVALGHRASGIMGNDKTLISKIKKASDNTGEKVWEIPLWEEYTEEIKGTYADIQNIGSAGAGTITAGAFLKEFVGNTPWCHFDIAGTAWGQAKPNYQPKFGATGVAVRLVYNLIEGNI